jgi:hypothetical protein
MSFIDRDSLTIITRKTQHKKINIIRVSTIKLYLLAQEGKSNSIVTPILGQFKINNVEFFKKFNIISSLYINGLPLSVKIYKLINETTEIIIRLPAIYVLMWIHNNEESIKFKISKFFLFDLIRIESRKLNFSLKRVSRIIFGILKSYKIKKIN